MKKIKFRTWALGKMGKPVTLEYIAGCMPRLNLSKCNPIMQYTGLKDKNGKEIYEGDIIQCFYESWDYETNKKLPTLFDMSWINGITIIKWGEYGGWYPFVDNDDGMPYPDPKISEIIGNIYENPELLE